MKTQDQISLGINLKEEKLNMSATSWVARMVSDFEERRFGLMSFFMVLQVCLASVAVFFIFENGAALWQLMIATVLTMFSNAMLIAQAPAKWCVAAFYLSIVFNTLFVVINL